MTPTLLNPKQNEPYGFHLEVTNICTLKCSGCARTRFIEKWPEHWKNHSIDVDVLLKFIDIDLKDTRILLCGVYGDPIYHPDFHQLIAALKQRGVIVHIVTNGSYRSETWWQQLCNELTSLDTVTFSIDGTPENFKQYRVNADWPSIEIGIRACAAARCQTIWKYIPFSYNQNCIAAARNLSQTLGIDQFIVSPSNRFDQQTEHLKPTDNLVDASLSRARQTQIVWHKSNQLTKLDPFCNDNAQHFISADGYYVACCFLSDHRFLYKTAWGKQREQFSISNTTFTKLLESENSINFYKDLSAHASCHYFCSKI